jgi:uncharacterized protein (UPF0305 family)
MARPTFPFECFIESKSVVHIEGTPFPATLQIIQRDNLSFPPVPSIPQADISSVSVENS